MEIGIKTPFGEMKFDMTQEKIVRLLQVAMSLTAETEPTPENQMNTVPQHAELEAPLVKPRRRVESLFPGFQASKPQATSAESEQEQGYKGFLLIKCAKCGNVFGLCSKTRITTVKCHCGGEVPLHDLKPAYLECKCGSRYKYRTNIVDDLFTYNCLNCGAPVDMVLNKSGTAYITLRESSRGRE